MSQLKKLIHQLSNDLMSAPADKLTDILNATITEDCQWFISHPVNKCRGTQQILNNFILPLRHSLQAVHRRNFLVMEGESVTGSGHWVATMGHYYGNFKLPLFGIPAHDHLACIRSGEFFRIENGKICEVRILVDFIDLMRQVGKMPLPEILGTEMQFPAPATGDGIMLSQMPDAQSKHSVELVSNMLAQLRTFDPKTFASERQSGKDGYWHEQMLWYGPCGIGSNYRYAGFEKDHRVPFLTAFPDRIGGNHYTRFGDGNYVASGGWPSINATHLGEYLGVEATGTPLTMRVMDFWRVDGDKIMENWVLIDLVDVFLQMGVDLFERIK